MAEFFLVVPPGWEDELLEEIREFEPLLVQADGLPATEGLGEFQIERGGVTFRADPLLALQVHFFSRLASRCLVRIQKFQATEFFQLEKRLKAVDLKTWIGDAGVGLKIEAQKSKINNEKRIREIAERVWSERIKNPATQTIFIRNDQDHFTVSLDLSGEHLHRRSTGRELGGPAPIRETLASRLIRFLIDRAPASVLRGVTLVDPMAGSGTLLSEASLLYAPRLSREFAFQTQPWIPKILKSATFSSNYRLQEPRIWKKLIALDQFPLARERMAVLRLPSPLEILEKPTDWTPIDQGPVWVIANPPYGERLDAIPTQELAQTLLSFGPARVAVILPERAALALHKAWPPGWISAKFAVSNGGIPCFLLRFLKVP